MRTGYQYDLTTSVESSRRQRETCDRVKAEFPDGQFSEADWLRCYKASAERR